MLLDNPDTATQLIFPIDWAAIWKKCRALRVGWRPFYLIGCGLAILTVLPFWWLFLIFYVVTDEEFWNKILYKNETPKNNNL
jgi:hypothetical protein